MTAAVAAVEDEGADDREHDRDEPVDAERLDRFAGGVAEEVGEQADPGRPADPAERVPEKERAPAHVRGAGQPRGPDAQAEDETAKEHGLRAVALEERLAGLEHILALALKAA